MFFLTKMMQESLRYRSPSGDQSPRTDLTQPACDTFSNKWSNSGKTQVIITIGTTFSNALININHIPMIIANAITRLQIIAISSEAGESEPTYDVTSDRW